MDLNEEQQIALNNLIEKCPPERCTHLIVRKAGGGAYGKGYFDFSADQDDIPVVKAYIALIEDKMNG